MTDAFIDSLIQKYNLKKGDRKDDGDLWFHKPSGKWLIRHHAMQRIFDQEHLEFPHPELCWSGEHYHRHLQLCQRLDIDGELKTIAWAFGEATAKTCAIGYYGVMASYRGIALSGKRALGWSGHLYSEHEADWDRRSEPQNGGSERSGGRPRPAPREAPERPGRPQRGSPSHARGGAAPAKPGGGRTFEPPPWQNVDQIRGSIIAGAPPAFSPKQLADDKFRYKSGFYQGFDWIDAYMQDFQKNGTTDHIEKQIQAIGRRWEEEGIDDFSIKRLHTLYWIRFRVDPKTGREVPLDECTFPDSWYDPSPPPPPEPEPWDE